MKKFGTSMYNLFAKTANAILTLVIIAIILITMFIGNIFNRPKLGFDRVDAIVTYYSQEEELVYMEYEYNNDTMLAKVKSNISMPVGHLVTLDIDKDNPTKFEVIDTNLVTDTGRNKVTSIAAISLVCLVLYKLLYGPFIKQKNEPQEYKDDKLKN